MNFIFVLIEISLAQIVTWGGKCIDVPLISDFDIENVRADF